MSLRIRLSRGGAKKRPYYRIVVAESTSPRDGRFIERIGTYNPMLPTDHDQRVTFKAERVEHWLKMGATPTDRVHKMLGKAGLADPFTWNEQPKKSAPGKKRAEREAEEAAKAAQAAEAAKAAAEAPAESEEAAGA